MIPIDQMFDYWLMNTFLCLMSVYLPFWNMSQSLHVTSQKVMTSTISEKEISDTASATTIMPEEDRSNNALGLNFAEKSESHTSQEPSPDLNNLKKEKEKPYVNPERVKTGGAQRVRALSL